MTRAGSPRDRGTVLALVLIFTVVAGVVLTAVTTLAITSLRTATDVQRRRDTVYASAAVMDLHIEYLRNDNTLAPEGGSCPSVTTNLNGKTVTITCINTGAAFLGREIDLTASVGGDVVLRANVHLDFGTNPIVDVNKWTFR